METNFVISDIFSNFAPANKILYIMEKSNSKDYTALIVVAIALVLLFGVIIFFTEDCDMSVLYWVFGIIAGILNICLFVKLWVMTNDVRELKEYFLNKTSVEEQNKEKVQEEK